jgi:hypothetical protein
LHVWAKLLVVPTRGRMSTSQNETRMFAPHSLQLNRYRCLDIVAQD